MFPYYQPCFDLRNPFYGFQNLTPILSYNYFPKYVPLSEAQNVKLQEEAPVTQNSSVQSLQALKEEPEAINLKIKIPAEFGDISQNDDIQNFQERNQNSENLKKTKLIMKNKQKQNKKKIRGQKKDKAYVAKQYPKQEPSINCRYIQKNFELNIINQVFSFLWSEQKSMKFTKKFLKDNVKISLFYEYIKTVRKFCKRYINKEYLKNLCDYKPEDIAYKMVTKNSKKLDYFSMEQFSRCIRYLIFIYLHQLCPQSILTSKKMRKQIWGEHLIKCRLLRNYMFCGLSADEYEKLLIHNPSQSKQMVESTSEDNSQ